LKRHLASSLLGKPHRRKLRPTSDIPSRYPELQSLYIKQLRLHQSHTLAPDAFQSHLSRYFSGELPHSRDILTSLLQSLMDGPTPGDPRCDLSGDCNAILRVSPPWPIGTKQVLCMSLDKGIFEDSHLTILPGSGSTEYTLHFAGVVDEGIGSPFSRREFPNYRTFGLTSIDNDFPVCRSEFTYHHDATVSPSTLVTIIHIHFLCPHTDQLAGHCVLYVYRLYQLQATRTTRDRTSPISHV